MTKKHLSPILLTLILLVAFCLRLYRVDYPLLDWHSFRQADTASVTQEFIRHDYPIWEPHYHDLGNIQSGQPNPEGYRLVEFPLVNYLQAQILRAVPTWDLVTFSRICAAFFSTISVWLLYLITKHFAKTSNTVLPLLAAATMAVLPYAVYFGRTILPEPYQLFFILATIFSFAKYLAHPKIPWWLFTLFSFLFALLIKPTSIFIAPLLIVLSWQKFRWRAVLRLDLWLLAILAVLPLLAWRSYIQQFPAGIPASDWLFNSDGIRLRPAWWRWLFVQRLTQDWLGYTGIVFFLCGLFPSRQAQKKSPAFPLSSLDLLTYVWLSAMFLYLVIFATGNVRHDYYQYLLLPPVCLCVARGLLWIYRRRPTNRFAITSAILLALFFATGRNLGKFDVHHWDQVHLGALAQQLLPPAAIVIADTADGDTNFLFQTRHRGYSTLIDLDQKIAAGATHLLRIDRDDLYHQLLNEYQLLYQDENGYIFDLQHAASPSPLLAP